MLHQIGLHTFADPKKTMNNPKKLIIAVQKSVLAMATVLALGWSIWLTAQHFV